jgi:hypothetical protein
MLRLVRAALAAFVLLGGCTPSGSPRLEGKWRGVRAEGVAPEAQTAANTFATQTELVFKGDSVTVVTPKEKQSGRYRVVRESGAEIVIVTDGDAPEDQQTFTIEGEHALRWSLLDGKTIVFARQ